MQAKKDTTLIPPKLIQDAIEAVKSKHYLGSSNKKTNPTGGLNGYYLNRAREVYKNYMTSTGLINKGLYPYLMRACLNHIGAANCGEMSAALYIELFLQNITAEQKQAIKLKGYDVNNAHGHNSYVLINTTVYDIWDNKKFKQSRIKAETHVPEKKHIIIAEISPTADSSFIQDMSKRVLDKFATEFDALIVRDRQFNMIYPTLDKKDPSDYALWASDTFPYLFTKFMETLETHYFITRPELASSIQEKIIKDYIFLIEELRQDIPLDPSVASNHPGRIRYEEDEVSAVIKELIPNTVFTDFILAMSYQNSNPEKAITLLTQLQNVIQETSEKALENALLLKLPTLVSTLGSKLSNATVCTSSSAAASSISSTATSTQGPFNFFPLPQEKDTAPFDDSAKPTLS